MFVTSLKEIKPANLGPSFIEGKSFTLNKNKFLSETELKGLIFALADDPMAGAIVAGFRGLRCLKFAGARIHYAISQTFEVWLLDIEVDEDDPTPPGVPILPPTPDDGLLKKALDGLAKGGMIAVGKHLADYVIDLITSN